MSEQGDSQNSNLYLSEPIDQPSQNSYVKVNRKFLNDLQQIHQIQQISHYRKQSSDNQSKLSVSGYNDKYKKSPYKQQQDFQHYESDSEQQNAKSPSKEANYTNAKQQSDNNQNTLEYYLLRKSVKTNNDQSRSKISLFNDMIQKQRQLLNFKMDANLTRYHSPQRSIIISNNKQQSKSMKNIVNENIVNEQYLSQ